MIVLTCFKMDTKQQANDTNYQSLETRRNTGSTETLQNDTANTENNGQNHSAPQNLEKDESEDKLILCRQKCTLQQR